LLIILIAVFNLVYENSPKQNGVLHSEFLGSHSDADEYVRLLVLRHVDWHVVIGTSV